MASKDELVEDLMHLGLTLYEARSYLILTKYGELTSTDLVRLAGIPQSRVYDVMSSLQRKGFVLVQSSRPMKFRAIDPSIAIKRLVENVTEGSKKLASKISQYSSERRVFEPSLWIVKGKENIINWLEKLILESNKEILLAVPSYLLKILYPYLLEAYEKRSVSLTLVVYPLGNDEGLIKKLSSIANVRIRDIIASYILISDNIVCIMGSTILLNTEECYADIIEKEDELMSTLAYFFNQSLFVTAKPIEPLFIPSKEVTYMNVWSAIEVVKNITSCGGTAYAKVIGKFIKSKEAVQVEGKVTLTNVIPGLIYSLTLETNDGKTLTIGGARATLEDIEAREITIWKI
jgi:sugar-specific transcriptional regulator TrmB